MTLWAEPRQIEQDLIISRALIRGRRFALVDAVADGSRRRHAHARPRRAPLP